MNNFLKYIIYSIFISVIFYFIPNKSNFNKLYFIPIIALIIIKYTLGDLDKNYIYSILDIYFVFIVTISSYLTILTLNFLH